METRFSLVYTLYSNNLLVNHRSFAEDITMRDFEVGKSGVNNSLFDAHKIVYVNPRGQSFVLYSKVKK